MERLLVSYNKDNLYKYKKAEYAMRFLLLVIGYSTLSFLISIVMSDFKSIEVVSYIIWLITASLIFYLIYKGRLETSINIFFLAGFIKSIILILLPIGLYFYVHIFLTVFVISVVKYREYQIVSVYILTYFTAVIKALLPDQGNIYNTTLRLVSYRISVIIGVLMFFVVLYYLSRIVDRAIRKIESYDLLSKTDVLTGGNNRLAFNNDVDELNRDVGNGLLILDLDHFKSLNDEYGHLAGDKVLRLFAELVKEYLNDNGMLYRIGGEEFAVLLPDLDKEELDTYCSEIIGLVNSHDFGLSHQVTTSIGAVYMHSDTCPDFDECYKSSDEALYTAKTTGRNKYVLA